ncbi:MAG: hypothetical protein FJ288_09470 [Planctomycetes bacterium]|nr:hypothetical protein [Planctomycetota bacterium]
MRQLAATVTVVLAALLAPGTVQAEQPGVQIDCAFPGGNIIVDRIEGDRVYLRQDLRDTAGHWFYWHFRARGAAGRTLTFHFMQGDVLTRMGPCCSLDGGKTWKWLGPDAVRAADPRLAPGPAQGATPAMPDPRRTAGAGQSAAASAPARPPGPIFVYTFAPDAADVRFAFSIPYLESDLKAFLARHAGRPELKAAALCRTAKGREAEVLYLGRMDEKADYRLAFTCRHHACESTAGFVLEGILEAALADDETGQWFRRRAAIAAVPFVDKDGVEDGDQGKNRKPRDHNRDYGDDTIHATVAAIKKFLPEWSRGRLDAAIDLHCPSVKDDFIHFVGGPEPEFWERALKLCKILEEGQKGPLRYAMSDNVPFGTKWNTGTGPLVSFGRWARTLPGVRVATTIEFPYALAHKTPVTADAARAFGRDVAEALRKYLETGK